MSSFVERYGVILGILVIAAVIVGCLLMGGCSDWFRQTKLDPPRSEGKKSDWQTNPAKGEVTLKKETPTDCGTVTETWTFPPGTEVKGKDVELENRGLGMETNQPVKDFDPGDVGPVDLKDETAGGIEGAKASTPITAGGVSLLYLLGALVFAAGIFISIKGGFMDGLPLCGAGIGIVVIGYLPTSPLMPWIAGTLVVGVIAYAVWQAYAKGVFKKVAGVAVAGIERIQDAPARKAVKKEVLGAAGTDEPTVRRVVKKLKKARGLSTDGETN